MTKAIIFDLGGVLVDLDLDNCRKHFIDILGYRKIYELLDPSHQRGIYSDLEEGILSPDEFRDLILSESRPGCVREQVDECMRSFLVHMDAYKVPMLKDFSGHYDLYILSNNNEISMRRCHEVFSLNGLDYRKVFRKEFISYEMKLLKPGKEIFLQAAKETGLPKDELLFIDDSMNNVEGAEAAGIPAVNYPQGSDLCEALNAKLLELNGPSAYLTSVRKQSDDGIVLPAALKDYQDIFR